MSMQHNPDMRLTLARAHELARAKYPDLEINLARDGSDVIELLLYDNINYHLPNCIVASYNKWYDEITFYSLINVEDLKEEVIP